jgi:hypothetical protein
MYCSTLGQLNFGLLILNVEIVRKPKHCVHICPTQTEKLVMLRDILKALIHILTFVAIE